MKRVLLLTDFERDLQTQRCVEQITVGLAGDYQFTEERVRGSGAVAALGQFFRVRNAARSADLVHAWGDRAMRLATMASETPILFTPLPDDPTSSVRWLRSAMLRRTMHVLTLSVGEDRLLVSRGIPAESCSLVRPGVRIARQIGRDDDLRKRLGFTPENKVILLVGETRGHADHGLCALAVSLLVQIDPSYRLLMVGDGDKAESLEALHASWDAHVLVNARRALGADMKFEDLLPAADAGVIAAPDRVAVVPILACMAGGLPLVGPATHAVSELLEDRHTALLYSPRRSRTLAQRLLMLFDDSRLRSTLSDQSRAEAYELFSVSRFLDEMRRIYA